jgi:hypothetical protein
LEGWEVSLTVQEISRTPAEWAAHYKAVARRMEGPRVARDDNVAEVYWGLSVAAYLVRIAALRDRGRSYLRSLQMRGEVFSAKGCIGPRVRQVMRSVAQRHGYTVKDLTGPRRNLDLCRARQEAIFEVYSKFDFSLPRTGQFFGDRDHTTILHSIRAHCHRNGLALPRGMTMGDYVFRRAPKSCLDRDRR